MPDDRQLDVDARELPPEIALRFEAKARGPSLARQWLREEEFTPEDERLWNEGLTQARRDQLLEAERQWMRGEARIRWEARCLRGGREFHEALGQLPPAPAPPLGVVGSRGPVRRPGVRRVAVRSGANSRGDPDESEGDDASSSPGRATRYTYACLTADERGEGA